jgi:hypothetical protein
VSGQAKRSEGCRAPAAVDAGTEQVVEQVVAGRNRVEHPGDAIRSFIGSDSHSYLLIHDDTTNATGDLLSVVTVVTAVAVVVS